MPMVLPYFFCILYSTVLLGFAGSSTFRLRQGVKSKGTVLYNSTATVLVEYVKAHGSTVVTN